MDPVIIGLQLVLAGVILVRRLKRLRSHLSQG